MEQSEERSVIVWRGVSRRPEEGSYVLLKCVDESGRVVCDGAAYEGGKFLYVYDREAWGEINEELILGWSYYPFDER